MQTQTATRTSSTAWFNAVASSLLLVLANFGCASDSTSSHPLPSPGAASAEALPIVVPASVKFEDWEYRDQVALTVRSPHYSIHTTISDRRYLIDLASLMESALAQYQRFTPGVVVSADPMECFMFATRNEWCAFTAARTGADSALYLRINRGGYTVRDWYVAFDVGESNLLLPPTHEATYQVAAHEGWHQFVARNFKSRMPPFLEEGIATMFENVHVSASEPPSWDLSPHSQRAIRLRNAIATNSLFPLDQLVTMHAGEVVGMPGPRIEAFYAQSWAFAEFLWNAEGGKYRPAFQRLLSDCANGTARPADIARRSIFDGWNPASVKPMLETYLCMPLDDIDRAYQSYIRQVAFPARLKSGNK